MAKPYSTTAQVLNEALAACVVEADWDTTEVTGDVAKRISEGDNEIDGRLAGLEVALPFTTNPPALQDLSVMYARYACLRDMWTASSPKDAKELYQAYKDEFEAKFKRLQDGWARLVDSTGAVVVSAKFATVTVDYPTTAAGVVDMYPNYPSGPYPDPPGVETI